MDKVALVTGSTSGIGEEIARELYARGYSVILNSSSSHVRGKEIEHELSSTGSKGKAAYFQADVSIEDEAEALVAFAVSHFGRLDVLINNAATTVVIPHSDLLAVTDEVWNKILVTNVIGPWHMVKFAAPHLKQAGSAESPSSIINITSIAGIRPTGSSIPYGASKAAVNQMTTTLAAVLGPEVQVNAVAPGFTETPWTADWGIIKEFVANTAPARRTGKPSDVARACIHIAESTYLTGQVLVVDGGLTLRS